MRLQMCKKKQLKNDDWNGPYAIGEDVILLYLRRNGRNICSEKRYWKTTGIRKNTMTRDMTVYRDKGGIEDRRSLSCHLNYGTIW